MKDFMNKIDESKLPAIAKMAPLEFFQEEEPFDVHPDYDVNTYQGPIIKEYYISDEIDLSEKYRYILSCNLDDYGWAGFDMRNRLSEDGSGTLRLKLSFSDHRARKIVVEGSLLGSSYEIANPDLDPTAVLTVHGVKQGVVLSIFQDLLLDAYSLEDEGNLRVAFFSYFTALEALVTSELEHYKLILHSELHYALEHLQLDEKIRIFAKESMSVDDLNSIPSWGHFSGTLRELKEKRNKIAHGQNLVNISQEDVDKIFAVICAFFCYSQHQVGSFVDIRKTLYPKAKRPRFKHEQ